MRCIGFFGYGVPCMFSPLVPTGALPVARGKHCQFFMIVQRWALLPQAVFPSHARHPAGAPKDFCVATMIGAGFSTHCFDNGYYSASRAASGFDLSPLARATVLMGHPMGAGTDFCRLHANEHPVNAPVPIRLRNVPPITFNAWH